MTALAAHEILLKYQTGIFSGSTYAVGEGADDVTGAKDVTLSINGDILDTTDFADGTFRTKLTGLRDGSLSFSANFEAGAGAGSAQDLFDKLTAGTPLRFFVGYTGASGGSDAGIMCVARLESVEVTGAVDGLVEMSVSAQLDASQETVSGTSGPIFVS
jgi:hypothetical protein